MEHVSSVRPTGKFPEKVENLKRWARFPGWNFWTESRVPFYSFLVVCTSFRFTARKAVEHPDVPGFTTKRNNFLPVGNSTFAPTEIYGFFPKWKAPSISRQANYLVIFLFVWQCVENVYWVSLTFFDQKQQKAIKSRLSSNLIACEKE